MNDDFKKQPPPDDDDSLDWLNELPDDEQSEKRSLGFTGELSWKKDVESAFDDAAAPDEDDFAWLQNQADDAGAPQAGGSFGFTSQLDWKKAVEQGAPLGEDDDSLDWLSGVESESAPTLPSQPTERQSPFAADDDDALAWLRQHPESAAADTTPDAPAIAPDESSIPEASDEDPLAWLAQYEPKAESPAPQSAALPVDHPDLPADDEQDPLAWLAQYEPKAAATPAPPAGEAEADELPGDGTDSLEWLAQYTPDEAAPPAAAAIAPDELDDSLAWLRQYAPPEELARVDQAAAGEWAQDDDAEDELPEPEAMPDWLAQMNVSAAPAPDDDDDLLAGLDEALGLPAQPPDEMPDWLQAAAPQAAPPESGDIFAQLDLDSPDTGYDFLDKPDEPAEDDILSGLQLGEAQTTDWFAETEQAAAPADEIPSWLRQLETPDEGDAQAEADFLAELRGADPTPRKGASDFDLPDFSSFEARGLEDIDRLLESYQDIEPALPSEPLSLGDDALERLLSDEELERIASARRGDAGRAALPELSPDAPEWLSEIGAMVGSVGEVSAAAILRKQAQQERPLEELSERLLALHEAGKQLPPPRDETPPDALKGILTGIHQVIAPTPIRPGLPGLAESAALSPAQRDKLRLLRGLVALDAPRAAGRSAVDMTLDAPELDELFDAAPDAKAGEKPAVRHVMPARRLRPKLDRLLLALLLSAAVALPFVAAPLRIGDLPAREFAAGSRGALAYQQVEALNAGDLVLVAVEYGPTGAAELDDSLDALLRHILLRGGRPTLVSANPLGLLRARNRLETLTSDARFVQQLGRENRPLTANVDYYVLRYLVGDAVGLRLLSGDIAGLAASDINGQPTDLQVTTLNDFDLIVVIAERAEDVRAWAEQVAPLTGSPFLMVTGFSAAPLAEPYALPGGLLVGYRDAYTYRAMLDGSAGIEAPPPITPPPITTVAPPVSTPEATAEALEAAGAAAEATAVPLTSTVIPPTATPAAPTDAATLAPSATVEPSATPPPTATRRPTLTPTPSVSPTPGTGVRGVVNTNESINVRQGPGRSFAVVTGLSPGDIVEIIGRNADESWYQVRLADGREGWVVAQFLLLEIPGAATPTAESARRADPNAVVALDGGFSFGALRQEATAEGTPEATSEALEAAPEPDATALPAAAAPAQNARPVQPQNRDARWYSMTLGLIVIIAVIALGAIVNILRGLFSRGAKA